jgi:acetyltransferase-like isoleucine patch superfamily enzyme
MVQFMPPPHGWDHVMNHGRCDIGAYSVICCHRDPLAESDNCNLIPGENVYLGNHSNIRAAGGNIAIGSNTLIGNNVTIVASNHGTKLGVLIRLQDWVDGQNGVIIGDDVWIGAGAIILPGVTVGSGSIVAAGSVVVRSVAPNTIVGGIPAKLIRDRV